MKRSQMLVVLVLVSIILPVLGITEANPILVQQWWNAPVEVIIDARDRLNRAIVDKGGEAVVTNSAQPVQNPNGLTANSNNVIPEQSTTPKGIKDQESEDICAEIEEGLAVIARDDADEHRVYYDDQDDVFYAYCVCNLATYGIKSQYQKGETKTNDTMKLMLGLEIYSKSNLFRMSKQTHKSSSFVYAYVNGIYDNFGDYDLVDDWSKYPLDRNVVLYAISIDRETDALDPSNFKVYDPWFGDNKIHVKLNAN